MRVLRCVGEGADWPVWVNQYPCVFENVSVCAGVCGYAGVCLCVWVEWCGGVCGPVHGCLSAGVSFYCAYLGACGGVPGPVSVVVSVGKSARMVCVATTTPAPDARGG